VIKTRDAIACTNDLCQADNLSDVAILREVMNTVGKPGWLSEHICGRWLGLCRIWRRLGHEGRFCW